GPAAPPAIPPRRDSLPFPPPWLRVGFAGYAAVKTGSHLRSEALTRGPRRTGPALPARQPDPADAAAPCGGLGGGPPPPDCVAPRCQAMAMRIGDIDIVPVTDGVAMVEPGEAFRFGNVRPG